MLRSAFFLCVLGIAVLCRGDTPLTAKWTVRLYLEEFVVEAGKPNSFVLWCSYQGDGVETIEMPVVVQFSVSDGVGGTRPARMEMPPTTAPVGEELPARKYLFLSITGPFEEPIPPNALVSLMDNGLVQPVGMQASGRPLSRIKWIPGRAFEVPGEYSAQAVLKEGDSTLASSKAKQFKVIASEKASKDK